MSWRLRLSVETILRLTPAVLGSTVLSIAGLCAAHACLAPRSRSYIDARTITLKLRQALTARPNASEHFESKAAVCKLFEVS